MAPLVIAAAGVGAFAAVRWWTRPVAAELIAVQDVPDDVAAELAATWRAFEDAFPARQTCIDDVFVELVASVDGGDARYVAGTSTIEIEIPTTPARFRESIAHELAHHIEATCAAFGSIRREIHPLLGGVDRPWSAGRTWYDIPSERWAEHVAELVNGERVRHVAEIPTDPVVLDLIERWGTGAELG